MNLLDEIFALKREQAGSRAKKLAELRAAAADAAPVRGFEHAVACSPKPVALIAEVKRCSPSAGPLNPALDPVAWASAYEASGAAALSVLTDREHFQGCPEDLISCREATTLPVLRKDFLVDIEGVFESRAMGADAVLLIVAGLEPTLMVDMRQSAQECGMAALFEAHDQREAETALECGATLLGVNNRDLRTFKTDPAIGERVLPGLVGRATLVSESALRTRGDVERVANAGARAVLIGTAFCRSNEPASAVKEVMGW